MSINQKNSRTQNFSPKNQTVTIPISFYGKEQQLPLINLKQQDDHGSEFQPLGDNQISQKQSAQNKVEDISKEQFSDEFVKQLRSSLDSQKKFMNQINNLKITIIQEQILSHITSNSGAKFQRLNYKLIQQYSHQRIQKMLKNKRKKKNWSEQDLKILVWIVAKYCEYRGIEDVYYGINQDDWKQISFLIPGTTSQMCMFKWLSLKKSKVRDQKWQQKQKDLLKKLVQQFGQNNWNHVAKRLFYQNPNKKIKVYRCGKQCRQHWNCFLNPNIRRGYWSKQQDLRLVKMILSQNVQRKWAKLATQFQGRTENALKNRYSIIIQKEKKQYKFSKKIADKVVLENYMKRNYQQQKQQTIMKDQKQKDVEQDIILQQKESGNVQQQVNDQRLKQSKNQINVENVDYQDLLERMKLSKLKFQAGTIDCQQQIKIK